MANVSSVQAERQADRTALTLHGHQSFSFAEFLHRVDKVSSGLADLGFAHGDRLGVWMPNRGEWLELQLATAKLGVILVNVNPDYRLPELEYALNLVACKGLVMVPRLSSDCLGMMQDLCPELASTRGELHSARLPSLRRVVVAGGVAGAGMLEYESLYRAKPALEARTTCDDAINQASTLTHRGILNNAYFLGLTMRYTEQDVVCVPVPLYHCFGCVMGNLSMVVFGCTLVYPSPRFDPLLTLHATVEHHCTSLYGVPTMFIAMLDHPEFSKFKFEVLRTGIMAGALCPVETMSRVIKDMGANEVTIAYGMTETSPVSWQTRIGTPLDLTCTTVGQICPHTECKVVDPEAWTVLPCGEPGELWTAGYLVMSGYWGNPKATAESIIEQDGHRWMRTGDLAVISEAGFCQIVGRIKDMILRGGENIFPKEVEVPLMSHPDILLAEVIGVPDHRLGEQVCAWVRWRGGAPRGAEAAAAAQRIRDFLRERVAHFKVPKYILFKDEFPLTASNKVRKVEVREITAAELGLVRPPSKL
ncbi:unnamed protein product [Prorocentrum cordatum]|uniref:Uncharacterized protein n=1 Tax=Prorocentrum cordatum TaxID=2364126 RepID=A0ABN9VWA4_9DINO|nr:unnamed protein product [Polarella glacialis]